MVRLTKQTDYALVLLTHMAREQDCVRWTAGDLAEVASLPYPMVSKILKALGRAGVLASQRGVKGGYSLAREAAEISVAEVVESLEGPISLTECTHPDGSSCEHLGHCPTAGNWRLINEAVSNALRGLTLDRMAQPMRRLPSETEPEFSEAEPLEPQPTTVSR